MKDDATGGDALTELRLALRRFADERDWAPYHTPKNLAMALSGEAGELIEHFQWLSAEQSVTLDEATRRPLPSRWPMCCCT